MALAAGSIALSNIGIQLAIATVLPSASRRAVAMSRTSRTIVEWADRYKLTPISSAIATNACPMMEREIGFMLLPPQNQVPDVIDPGAPAIRNKRVRRRFLHDRRTPHTRPG